MTSCYVVTWSVTIITIIIITAIPTLAVMTTSRCVAFTIKTMQDRR